MFLIRAIVSLPFAILMVLAALSACTLVETGAIPIPTPTMPGSGATASAALASTATAGAAAPTSVPQSSATPEGDNRAAGDATVLAPLHPPAVGHDLLYLNDGQLMRWHHASGRLQSVLESGDKPVKHYSVDATGDHAVAVRAAGQSGDPANEVLLVDLAREQVALLFTAGTEVAAAAISPDGRWLAYITDDAPATGQGRPTGLARPVVGDARGSTIYLLALATAEQPLALGQCDPTTGADVQFVVVAGACQRLVWSPDSEALAWSDARGVWIADTAGLEARQLATTRYAASQPEGIHVYQEVMVWSPSSDYLLVTASYFEGSSQVLLELATGREIAVPDSFEYVNPGPRMTWTPADLLLVARPGSPTTGAASAAELWRVSADAAELRLDARWMLPASPDNAAIGPAVFSDGYLALALVNSDPANAHDRALYRLNPATGAVTRLTGLPAIQDSFGVQVLWEPDGSAALVHGPQSLLLYVPVYGGPVYDLRPALGESACCPAWLP